MLTYSPDNEQRKFHEMFGCDKQYLDDVVEMAEDAYEVAISLLTEAQDVQKTDPALAIQYINRSKYILNTLRDEHHNLSQAYDHLQRAF